MLNLERVNDMLTVLHTCQPSRCRVITALLFTFSITIGELYKWDFSIWVASNT